MTEFWNKEYDVVVCGGGTAGFCAAIAAGRTGVRTLMLEKYGMPGGTMTVLGNNTVSQFINPFAEDRMVIKGIAWEFVERLHEMGYAEIPDQNGPFVSNPRYSVVVNSLAASKLIDDMLSEAGVDVLYDCQAVDVGTEKENGRNRITHVIISTKSGLKPIRSRFFIDCTGDGDICVWAGNPFEIGGESGELQPGTMRVYFSGELTEDLAEAQDKMSEMLKNGEYSQNSLFTGPHLKYLNRGDNRNHVFDLNAADTLSRSKAEINTRKNLFAVQEALRKSGSGVTIEATAPVSAPRESRRILGDGYLTQEDYLSCKKADDAVCYTYWYVDIHGHGEKDSPHIYMNSPLTPSVPYSCLIPQSLTNVLVAGRCVSADRGAESALRVKASCMAMGQAAGTAAALCTLQGLESPRELDVSVLKKKLSEDGCIVP